LGAPGARAHGEPTVEWQLAKAPTVWNPKPLGPRQEAAGGDRVLRDPSAIGVAALRERREHGQHTTVLVGRLAKIELVEVRRDVRFADRSVTNAGPR
jgi:hypothetical protein